MLPRPRSFRALTGIASVAGLCLLGAVAYATRSAAPSTGRADVDTLRPLAALEPGSAAAAMTEAEQAIVRRALPASSDDDPNGLGEDDLTGQGRNLLATVRGERLSATRLRGGQVCWSYGEDGAPMAAACAQELLPAGIDVAGVWSEDGQVRFGLADDSVARVHVRTNTGELQAASLGRNAYLWASASPDRSLWATAILVTHEDGSTDTVELPDEGIATRAGG